MQKIFCKIGESTYLVGYSTTLMSFLESLNDEISTVQYRSPNHARCYHNNQRMEVDFSAETIRENERVFYKAI